MWIVRLAILAAFTFPGLWDGYGETILSTASLMERDQAYLLEVELARGTLNRIRNQVANWEQVGMIIPEPIRHATHWGHRNFLAGSDFPR